MDDARTGRALVGLFFVSGATSLVYQTVWQRELHLLLGTSSAALATVLAAFMGGLGLGGIVGARWAPPRPLAAYGRLEALIGLYALAFPTLVDLAEPAYLAVVRGPLLPAAGPLQALLAGALLLPPTVAMGATLPLLVRVAVDRIGTAADRVSALYAANTAGAVVGTAVAGLALLPTLGLATTTAIAAAGNGLVAALAFGLDPWLPPLVPRDDLEADDRPDQAPAKAALAAIALGGAAALASEVLWTRMVGLLLGGTTYAFTAMLLAVLVGIAIGARFAGPFADDALRYGGTHRVLLGLAGVEAAVAAACFGLTFLWTYLPYGMVALYDLLGGEEAPAAMFLASFAMCTVLLVGPAALMGAAFPYAVRAVAGDRPDAGGPVGRVYAWNTLGGVVGAVLAGFVGIPLLGLRGLAGAAAAVSLVAAAICVARPRPALAAALVGLAAVPLVVRAPWDPLWMSGGLYQYVGWFHDHTPAGLRKFTTHEQELLFEAEGRSTVVTVGRNTDTGNLWLANNGKVDASSTGDLPTQVLCALVGAQFVERPERVAVVGLASGITAGAATLLPGLGRLEVVELEPAMVDAARFFDGFNHGVLDHPRVTLVWNDGRNHLLRAPPGTYDLVISEPSNPYLSGVANLFTKEFWEMGQSRLVPGGVWAQWVQMYGMGPDELRGLLRTFAEVYPHVAVYDVLAGADLVLVGSDRPLEPTPARAAAFLADEAVAGELAKVGVRFPLDLVALHAMDRDQTLAFAGRAPLVTDDDMRVEYAAPLWLHTDVAIRNWEDLLAAAHVPWGVLSSEPLDWLDLAEAYEGLGDDRRAALVRARTLAHLDPREPLYDEVVARLLPSGRE